MERTILLTVPIPLNLTNITSISKGKRVNAKGVIERRKPGFSCVPLFGRDEILISETKSFIDRVYQGSFKQLFSQFIENRALSAGELKELRDLIDKTVKGGDNNA